MIRGDRLRERRLMFGMSQEELASHANTDQKRISKYENGQSDATGDTLEALAKALNTSTDWLLGLSADPNAQIEERGLALKERQAIAAWRRGDVAEAVKIIVNG